MTTTESSQFEGPEKLLEIWFAPSPADVERAGPPTEDGKYGLRKVDRAVWEDMLEIVKCKVLSVIEGSEMDAYLLRSVTPPSPLPIAGSTIHLTS
jgi:S-adenosylmethionine decarboxylase